MAVGLSVEWNDVSSIQEEDCMAKMIYTGRKLVTNLAYSALMKHIELGTSVR